MQTTKTILVSMFTAAITSVAVVFGLQHLQGEGLQKTDNVQIPSVTGLAPEQAKLVLEHKGLFLLISERREHEKVPEGHIIEQNPLEGSWVRKGGEVRVVLSNGRQKLQVPALANLSLTDAMQKLSATGLRVGAVSRQVSDTVPIDHVITTVPVTGENVNRSTPVNLVVSDGPDEATVPRVVGKGLSRAKQVLEEAGFQVGRVTYGYDEDRRGGVVIGQRPNADTAATVGSVVDLVVNESD
jgi:serine/threonine-protein kinase